MINYSNSGLAYTDSNFNIVVVSLQRHNSFGGTPIFFSNDFDNVMDDDGEYDL